MYKDIEFVCSGNEDRSPMCEATAKKHLDKKGLLSQITISSSGTVVDLVRKADDVILAKLFDPLIFQALDNGTITITEARDIRQGRNIRKIVNRLNQQRAVIRQQVFGERGYFQYINPSRQPRQTVARLEAELILPVDEKNFERAKRIYVISGLNPQIEILGNIGDPFLGTLEDYRAVAHQIEIVVLEAIEKYL